MKRIVVAAIAALFVFSGCEGLRDEIAELQREINNLKAEVEKINSYIESLSAIVMASQNEDYVKSVVPVLLEGEVIGYTINFAKSGSVTIYNGKDGMDGYTPKIGVNVSEDVWYWTVDGEWLLDASGNKIPANGSNGADGRDGKDGQDGLTPQLKIQDGYWYLSYDGTNWQKLGKATGENGDTMFTSVDTSNSEYVEIVLADGTSFRFPTWAAFEQLRLQVNAMNTNIEALQAIVSVLQNNDWITGVTPLIEDRVVVGYTITFAKAAPVVIYNGKDGADGKDGQDGKDGKDGQNGTTPQIGVKRHTDGDWYWTLNGEWLLDVSGNMIRANGQDGADGKDGEDGQDGKDGITPMLLIVDDYWRISYDNGATWTTLGKATGADGKDGKDGQDGAPGDSIFSSVTQDESNVYFTLSDGTVLTVPKSNVYSKYIQFEDLNVKAALVTSSVNTDGDFEISYEEAAACTELPLFNGKTSILSFDELKYFTLIKAIPANSFADCSSLYKMTLPNGITSIEVSAFKNCSSLIKINLPEGLITIGTCAFQNCTSLKSIILPHTLESIGDDAFSSVSLDYMEINSDVLVSGTPSQYTTSHRTLPRSIRKLVLSEGVTEIPASSFGGTVGGSATTSYKYGTAVQISECDMSSSNVTSIGNYAFSYCPLEKISFPSTLRSLGDYCFQYIGHDYSNSPVVDLISLLEGTESITSVGKYVFMGSNIKNIDFSGVVSAGTDSFKQCLFLETVVLGPYFQALPNNMFNGCKKLSKLFLMNTTPPSMGTGVFSSIPSIYVPSSSYGQYLTSWPSYSAYVIPYDFD